MAKRKICFPITSRAYYGRSQLLIKKLHARPDVDLKLMLGGSILLDKYSKHIAADIAAGGFEIEASLFNVIEGGNHVAMAKTACLTGLEFSNSLYTASPDVVVICGDRFEQLAIAMAAAYLNITIAHIEGGDVTVIGNRSVLIGVGQRTTPQGVETLARSWFRSTDAYNRQWAADHPAHGLAALLPDAARSLIDYHRQMWSFNTTLRTSHAYQSHPWSWLVLGRPTAFDYRSYKLGERGCRFEECSRAVTDLGNPVIWWGGTIAIAVLIVVWLLGRDWRAGAILAGLAGGYLPWFLWAERTIYTFYAVAFGPYVVLGLTMCLGLILGRADASADRRLVGAACAGGVVLLAVVTFAFFYPILSDVLISHRDWVDRMWLPSWI